jgi:hypothetical protein
MDPKAIALAYIEACGRKDLQTVERLLASNVSFVGPGNAVTGATAVLSHAPGVATFAACCGVRSGCSSGATL